MERSGESGVCGGGEWPPQRRSPRPCEPRKSFRRACPKQTAGCRAHGRCGGWRTAKRCWSPMKSIVARYPAQIDGRAKSVNFASSISPRQPARHLPVTERSEV